MGMGGIGGWGDRGSRERSLSAALNESDGSGSLGERHLASSSAMSRLSREMESSGVGGGGRSTHEFMQKLMSR